MTWPEDPFDVYGWLSIVTPVVESLTQIWVVNQLTQDIFEASGAENELEYYTDPPPYGWVIPLYGNPEYVSWKAADGVVHVERADDMKDSLARPADQLAKTVETINRVVDNLFNQRNHTI